MSLIIPLPSLSSQTPFCPAQEDRSITAPLMLLLPDSSYSRRLDHWVPFSEHSEMSQLLNKRERSIPAYGLKIFPGRKVAGSVLRWLRGQRGHKWVNVSKMFKSVWARGKYSTNVWYCYYSNTVEGEVIHGQHSSRGTSERPQTGLFFIQVCLPHCLAASRTTLFSCLNITLIKWLIWMP